jgi:hypothetical protein
VAPYQQVPFEAVRVCCGGGLVWAVGRDSGSVAAYDYQLQQGAVFSPEGTGGEESIRACTTVEQRLIVLTAESTWAFTPAGDGRAVVRAAWNGLPPPSSPWGSEELKVSGGGCAAGGGWRVFIATMLQLTLIVIVGALSSAGPDCLPHRRRPQSFSATDAPSGSVPFPQVQASAVMLGPAGVHAMRLWRGPRGEAVWRTERHDLDGQRSVELYSRRIIEPGGHEHDPDHDHDHHGDSSSPPLTPKAGKVKGKKRRLEAPPEVTPQACVHLVPVAPCYALLSGGGLEVAVWDAAFGVPLTGESGAGALEGIRSSPAPVVAPDGALAGVVGEEVVVWGVQPAVEGGEGGSLASVIGRMAKRARVGDEGVERRVLMEEGGWRDSAVIEGRVLTSLEETAQHGDGKKMATIVQDYVQQVCTPLFSNPHPPRPEDPVVLSTQVCC